VSEDDPLDSGDEYVMVLVRETWEAITAKRR
jgi:hypothetical protein